MPTHPLDPSRISTSSDRVLHRGHGTEALGPSDSSDNGSDLIGNKAGARIGDGNLDSDSDRHGTGERAAAGADEEVDGDDIEPDRIEDLGFGDEEDEDR